MSRVVPRPQRRYCRSAEEQVLLSKSRGRVLVTAVASAAAAVFNLQELMSTVFALKVVHQHSRVVSLDQNLCKVLLQETYGAITGWDPSEGKLEKLCQSVLLQNAEVDVKSPTDAKTVCTEFAEKVRTVQQQDAFSSETKPRTPPTLLSLADAEKQWCGASASSSASTAPSTTVGATTSSATFAQQGNQQGFVDHEDPFAVALQAGQAVKTNQQATSSTARSGTSSVTGKEVNIRFGRTKQTADLESNAVDVKGVVAAGDRPRVLAEQGSDVVVYGKITQPTSSQQGLFPVPAQQQAEPIFTRAGTNGADGGDQPGMERQDDPNGLIIENEIPKGVKETTATLVAAQRRRKEYELDKQEALQSRRPSVEDMLAARELAFRSNALVSSDGTDAEGSNFYYPAAAGRAAASMVRKGATVVNSSEKEVTASSSNNDSTISGSNDKDDNTVHLSQRSSASVISENLGNLSRDITSAVSGFFFDLADFVTDGYLSSKEMKSGSTSGRAAKGILWWTDFDVVQEGTVLSSSHACLSS
ncbi:unnamed protein product [Amoebophrya sp. A120]|nr:unnamed protein product [Amoebophrya sp. A120]|eukprot:GSA120T00008922001.1